MTEAFFSEKDIGKCLWHHQGAKFFSSCSKQQLGVLSGIFPMGAGIAGRRNGEGGISFTSNTTGMIKRCLELRLVPLGEFTIDDLRLMIGQAFVLPYLVPLALEHLRNDIFVESLYPGDLLETMLKIDQKFWLEHRTLWTEVFELINGKRAKLRNHRIDTTAFDSALKFSTNERNRSGDIR